MNSSTIIVLVLFLVLQSPAQPAAIQSGGNSVQAPIRIALPGSVRPKRVNDSSDLELWLAESLSRDPRVTLIDQSIMQPALSGFGYDGSINLSKDEARKLASAIGCDFFIVGKSEAFTRSDLASESHEEAYAGVLIVDGRTGALTQSDFVSNKASTPKEARQLLKANLEARIPGYIDRMTQARLRNQSSRSGATSGDPREIIEDIPADDSPHSLGFKPPEFLNRVKPDYSAEAELADVTATVEAMVVFRSNGQVSAVEITRWAGFGLDESSERAVRQLKFKPATRDGNAISVRAMIKYNFRRVTAPAIKPEAQPSRPPDKPEPDLRNIFKPTVRRP